MQDEIKVGLILNKEVEVILELLKTESHLTNMISGSFIYFINNTSLPKPKGKSIVIISGTWHSITSDYGHRLISDLMHYIQKNYCNITDLNYDLIADLSGAKCPKKIWELISNEKDLQYTWIES